jgi:glutamate synthase (NADPH/NADH) large chain
MMRKCHLNTCPVGVATQDPELRKNFTGQPDHVVNFFVFIANEVREIMAELGIRKFNDLIGRRDLLDFEGAETHWKAHGLDLDKLIIPLDKQDEQDFFNSKNQDHQLEKALDNVLIKKCELAISDKETVSLKSKIVNTNRTVGAMLSGVIAKKYGHNGLPNNTINIDFEGSAGQSFGAWLAKGISFNLEGDANDYVGKGLSGGKISVFPHSKSKIIADDNIIAGNTLLYGAISGECYLSGVVGERFAVRNSGATAVVEGCGDHGCEYMTGGVVVVLGKTGRNFAAGMSGGIAYVLDEDNSFDANCNKSMVDLEKLSSNEMNSKHTEKEINSDLLDFDISRLKLLINRHYKNTKSEKAKKIINNWEKFLPQFIKITPFEFRRALIERKQKLIDENIPSRIAGE